MRKEEIAYSKGYRISKDGKLYHLNGRKYKTANGDGGVRFCINIGNRKNITVYVGRLQAYQKFGKEFLEYKKITYLNGDRYDPSFNNIALGKGSERIKRLNISTDLHREQIAQKLGFSVTKDGVLLRHNFKTNYWINNSGYKMFCFTVSNKKSIEVLVHRLQAYQMFGEDLYDLPLVRHLDNDKLNNVPSNLLIGTYEENFSDMTAETKEYKYFVLGFRQLKYDVFLRNRLRVEYERKDMNVMDISRKYKIPYGSVYSIVKYKLQF